MKYEAVIGLEVHVQLKTKSKMFTRAPYYYGAPPNTLTDPVVLGLPGTLPVMNKEAVHKSAKVGLIFGSQIAEVCKWDRKNYFYPDSPKGYQISQFDQPICIGGAVEIELPGPSRNVMGEHRSVRLTRAHLEEDVGKLTHGLGESLVDFNRAGAPLLEIVTEPDMHTSEEAFAFLTSLRMHMVYAGISDCDMEKGQMRCDANVSIRPAGTMELGTKVEIKNLNTISGVRNGIDYEIKRQIRCIEEGEAIVQETRRWDAEKSRTTSMRSKEMSHDYRYFPDPDLMPVKLSKETVEGLRSELPEFPYDKQRRFLEQYSLPFTITSVLCPDRELSDYFEAAVAIYNNAKSIANLIANDLLRELAEAGSHGSLPLSECKVKPEHVAGLVKLIDEGVISKQIAQDVFTQMFKTGHAADVIVREQGLEQTSDTSELEALCRDIITNNPKPVEEFKGGNEKAINALKGQVMKRTQGKANPKVVDDVLKSLILN
ncbi:MAG: Asp-tRNA(Asn)/Glu-tRNA(Gln) amidotransferase subunit GatB [Opitutales bacterium]